MRQLWPSSLLSLAYVRPARALATRLARPGHSAGHSSTAGARGGALTHWTVAEEQGHRCDVPELPCETRLEVFSVAQGVSTLGCLLSVELSMALGSSVVTKPMRMLTRRLVRPGGGRFRSVREYSTTAQVQEAIGVLSPFVLCCTVLQGSQQ